MTRKQMGKSTKDGPLIQPSVSLELFSENKYLHFPGYSSVFMLRL
jgi:hypothetical protein